MAGCTYDDIGRFDCVASVTDTSAPRRTPLILGVCTLGLVIVGEDHGLQNLHVGVSYNLKEVF